MQSYFQSSQCSEEDVMQHVLGKEETEASEIGGVGLDWGNKKPSGMIMGAIH